MALKKGVSKITQRNWWTDALLAASALVTAISALYFLYLPSGGYQGGRNPYYGLTILFSRHTWEDLHIWGGIVMIAVVLIHLFFHWSWVVNMTRRTYQDLSSQAGKMSRRSRLNYLLNVVVAISFLLSAVSGIYFLFFPAEHGAEATRFLFSPAAWDLLHTWAGVTLIAAAVIHFAIHWRWAVNVTTSMAKNLIPANLPLRRRPAVSGER